jgi:hypothetical protein
MAQSVALVPVGQPARYVKQLVSHLGHRLSTELLADGQGVIRFEAGECLMTAGSGALVLTASAADGEELRHVQDVVARHLERFGAREGLRVSWSPPAG